MKKFFYVALWTFLGVLVSFLVHAAVEIPVIYMLLTDIDTYGLGISLLGWQAIHDVATPLLLLVGGVVGFMQGVRWWRIIYVEKRGGSV